ncbi:NB-ARC domain-containing protein [Saccharopolyspora sp. NPDC002686]|uniref:NB-ARC domain-containing protein n=1 Tax=Saccharopolyspora sp. NPDC002686 TaxID=3154541 RepID=UPI00331A56A1
MDRHEVLSQMRDHLRKCRGDGHICRMQVHGMPGVGTSSLVREFAERQRDFFDGQPIWLYGQQVDGNSVAETFLLRQALLNLGVPETELAATREGLKAAYHQRLSKLQKLIVVDGLVRSDLLKDLVPENSPESAIVVIAHELSRSLIPAGFERYWVKKLPDEEAVDLFRYHLRETAAEIDDSAIEELASLCRGIPLLIEVVAAQLVGRAVLAGPLLNKLRESSSALLRFDDEARIPSFLEVAYKELPKELRCVYRRCALIPGSSFSADAAAVVLGSSADDAAIVLHDLVDQNLLISDGERFDFHDLVRIDAQEKANREDGAQLCRELKAELVTWFVGEANPRDRALSDRWRAGPLFDQVPEPKFEVTREEALDWFAAELSNLLACVREAPALGRGEAAVQLAVLLFKYLHYHHHYDVWLEVHDIALDVATDRAARMQLHQQRGAGHLAVGELDRAEVDFAEFSRIAHEIGDKQGQQSSYEWIGKLKAKRGDLRGALQDYALSWEVVEEATAEEISPEQQERMFALISLQRARAFGKLGDRERAEQHVSRALEYFGEGTKEPDNRAKCLHTRGRVRAGVGARADLSAAAELFRSEGAVKLLADVLVDLGDAAAEDGDAAAVVESYEEALVLYEKIGDTKVDEVKAKLEESGH